jgi:hypothetical protein
MHYRDFLKTGNVNEITEAILDQLTTELRYRARGIPQGIVRDALNEFFERGRRVGAAEATNHIIGEPNKQVERILR